MCVWETQDSERRSCIIGRLGRIREERRADGKAREAVEEAGVEGKAEWLKAISRRLEMRSRQWKGRVGIQRNVLRVYRGASSIDVADLQVMGPGTVPSEEQSSNIS